MKIINTSAEVTATKSLPDNIIVFSHLRWDFVYQRPQHLLTRFAADFKISFIEEPIFDAQADNAYYTCAQKDNNLQVLVPHLPAGLTYDDIKQAQKTLFDKFMESRSLCYCAFWYYTPMALEFSRKHTPNLIIYDCMDELSAFKYASLSLKSLEQELLKAADVVFTGGQSLYQAKKEQHANIHPFPSSIDARHFNNARNFQKAGSAQPTLGFYGVIDERFDVELIAEIANARPNWRIELIGPIVKIDPAILPQNTNITYVGAKSYHELPAYLATWNIALIPFLLNESTRFISPTKTPEYLAAGLPVISTPIADVVNPYGVYNLVNIGKNARDFIKAAETVLTLPAQQKAVWLKKVDNFLAKNSWDKTHNTMLDLIKTTAINKTYTSIAQ